MNKLTNVPDAGLELETQCERALPPGSGGSAVDPATYYPCTDPSVSFRLDEGGKLDVRRTYRDDSYVSLVCRPGRVELCMTNEGLESDNFRTTLSRRTGT